METAGQYFNIRNADIMTTETPKVSRNGRYTLAESARLMACDTRTLYKYADRFGQRMLQGMADVHVDYVSIDGEVKSVGISVFPNDKNGKPLHDEKGEHIWTSFKIGSWNEAKEADVMMKDAYHYVKTITALHK